MHWFNWSIYFHLSLLLFLCYFNLFMIFLIHPQVSHSFSVFLLSFLFFLICFDYKFHFLLFIDYFSYQFISSLGVFQVYSREGETYQFLSFFLFIFFLYLSIYLFIYLLIYYSKIDLGVFQVYSREGETYQFLSFFFSFFLYLSIYLFIYLFIVPKLI